MKFQLTKKTSLHLTIINGLLFGANFKREKKTKRYWNINLGFIRFTFLNYAATNKRSTVTAFA